MIPARVIVVRLVAEGVGVNGTVGFSTLREKTTQSRNKLRNSRENTAGDPRVRWWARAFYDGV
jgi:hypothetical protein